MKKDLGALISVKQQIASLKGNVVNMQIHRGRKKFDTFTAIVDSVYPSVFTVKVEAEKQQASQTFSYFDVLCGDVIILWKSL